jgi:hypothetical protein
VTRFIDKALSELANRCGSATRNHGAQSERRRRVGVSMLQNNMRQPNDTGRIGEPALASGQSLD